MEHNVKVLSTNGHAWQLFAFDAETGFNKSKKLKSDERTAFENPDFVDSVLGLIRFGAGVKSDGQIMMEDMYTFYDEQMFLADPSEVTGKIGK